MHMLCPGERTQVLLCSIEVETADVTYADTSTGGSAQFSVGGVWSGEHAFPQNIELNEIVTVQEHLSARPSAIRLVAGGTNGWGYRRVSVVCGRLRTFDFRHILNALSDFFIGCSNRISISVKTSKVIVHGRIELNIYENTTFQCACGGKTFVLLHSDNSAYWR